jgi:hypothetical protein
LKNLFRLLFLVIVVYNLSFALQPKEMATAISKNFIIKYEAGIPKTDIQLLTTDLELQYKNWNKCLKLESTKAGQIEVRVYKNQNRYIKESRSFLKEEGCFVNGKVYLISPAMIDKQGGRMNIISRVAALAVLSSANDNGCPVWLSEAYGIYAGGDLEKYGTPFQAHGVTFRDLQQEYSQVHKEKEMMHFYSKLSEVIKFFITKYGEQKVDGMFAFFDGIKTFEQVFEVAFSDKYENIERSWNNATRNVQAK